MKYEILEMYNEVSNNPKKYSNKFRNDLFMIIAQNDWFEEYFKLYPDEFGLL